MNKTKKVYPIFFLLLVKKNKLNIPSKETIKATNTNKTWKPPEKEPKYSKNEEHSIGLLILLPHAIGCILYSRIVQMENKTGIIKVNRNTFLVLK